MAEKIGEHLLESRARSTKPKFTWTAKDGKLFTADESNYEEVRKEVLKYTKKLDKKVD